MFSKVARCSSFISRAVTKRFYHKVGVIGVPFNKGQPKNGVDRGPAALRESGLIKALAESNLKLDINDYGDISYTLPSEESIAANMINWPHVAACNQQLSNQVFEILKDNRMCLTLGGDHSIGFGTVDGHTRAFPGKTAVLWIDAHADINVNSSSPSGNLHGMPLALVAKELRELWPPLQFLEWQKPQLSLNNIAFIGLRSVDDFEKEILSKYRMAAFDMKDVQMYGIHNVIRMALNKIDPNSNCSLHVSFDIDSLDTLEAPSTGTPVRGGLTLREGIEIMEAVSDTGRLKAMDVVEVNPLVGTVSDVHRTLEAAREIVFAAFGHKRTNFKS